MSYTNPIALNAQGQRVGVGEMVDGEVVVYRVTFNRERWLKQRCCTCCCLMSTQPLYCINGLIYACVAGSCRQTEFESLDVFITGGVPGVSHGSLHAKLKMYGCGCCCQNTVTKTIPLDKIQDVQLVSDCTGDTFGFSSAPGKPWRVAIDTASAGARPGGPELVLDCLEDPEGFRQAVFAAKKGMPIPGSGLQPAVGGLAATGAGKETEGIALMANPASAVAMGGVSSRMLSPTGPVAMGAGAGVASAEVLNALLRIEKSINDGVALLAASQGKGASGGAGAGAGVGHIPMAEAPAPMHM